MAGTTWDNLGHDWGGDVASPVHQGDRRRRTLAVTVDLHRIGGAYWMPPRFQSSFKPARNAELRFRADVAFEDFTVIADRAHDIRRPIGGKAHLLAEIALDAHQATDGGLCRLQRFIDGLRADAELLGVDQSEIDPFDDVRPLRIVLTNRQTERLLRNHIWQNHMVAWIGHLQTQSI